MISRPLVTYILTAAKRDRLMLTLLLMIALGAALSLVLGAASVTEQAAFSMVFGSGGLRFLGVLGIVLFCAFYMRRAFDHKEVEFLLSRPLSRMTFLFSHAAAFILLALIVAAAVTLAVWLAGTPDAGGLVMWGFSLAVEYAVMAVAALFFSMVLSSAAGAALATLGFYVLARVVGTLLGIAALPGDNLFFTVLNNIMQVISILVPRLDLMGQTSWLVYGVQGAGGITLGEHAGAFAQGMMQSLGAGGFIAAQGGVFICLLLAAAAFDFVRRQF